VRGIELCTLESDTTTLYRFILDRQRTYIAAAAAADFSQSATHDA